MSKRPKPATAIASHLKAMREQRGLTQRELSLASGVHHISIAKFENGSRVPDIRTLEKLAKGLGVSTVDLFGEQTVVTSMEQVIADFLNSPWASVLKPHATADEIEWIRGLPGVVWFGLAPTPECVNLLIRASRAGKIQR